jgi:hypothetical protein
LHSIHDQQHNALFYETRASTYLPSLKDVCPSDINLSYAIFLSSNVKSINFLSLSSNASNTFSAYYKPFFINSGFDSNFFLFAFRS